MKILTFKNQDDLAPDDSRLTPFYDLIPDAFNIVNLDLVSSISNNNTDLVFTMKQNTRVKVIFYRLAGLYVNGILDSLYTELLDLLAAKPGGNEYNLNNLKWFRDVNGTIGKGENNYAVQYSLQQNIV
jgi:hypothetical protein